MRLKLFDVSRRWPRQRTQGNDGTSFREQLNFFHYLPLNSSALYYLQTSTRRNGHASTPPQFLPISGNLDVSLLPSFEWHVWSTSSGNNCHSVHRSLSSGASLCDGTVRFFTLSHIIRQTVFYNTLLKGWLVVFYGISTLVCYLMPNPFPLYILDIWFINK